MSRIVIGLAASVLAVSTIGGAQAADWRTEPKPVFKQAYPVDYAKHQSPLEFEAGLRYSYSMGSQSFPEGGASYSATDTSHALEAHLRIDDRSTSTYVKSHVGLGTITDGEYRTDDDATDTFNIGTIAYGTADFGYTPIETDGLRLGIFGGYQFAHEAPSGTEMTVHALRLGVSGRAQLADQVDINAEAALIPYAYAHGNMDNPDAATGINNFEGALYGGSAELMLGFRPTDDFIIRGGVRGTFLEGYGTTDGSDEQYIQMFRWGPVVELTASF